MHTPHRSAHTSAPHRLATAPRHLTVAPEPTAPDTRATTVDIAHPSARTSRIDQLSTLVTRVGPYVWPCLTVIGMLLSRAAIGGIMWLIVLAVSALTTLITTVITFVAGVGTWITTHLFLIAVIGIALLFLGTKFGACSGVHCRGCTH